MKRYIGLGVMILMQVNLLFGQERMLNNELRLERISENQRQPLSAETRDAYEYARSFDILPRKIDGESVIEIKRVSDGFPEFLKTQNSIAAQTSATDLVSLQSFEGYFIDGSGIAAAVWDGGKVRTSHQEFNGRAITADAGFEIVGHATHVAGTIAASGIESDARGMAPGALIETYDWNNDNNEMSNAAEDGLLLSNHSYGLIHGFSYNNSERRWEWYGNLDVSQKEDYRFGYYGNDARAWDQISRAYPNYLIVKSAGNDRNDGPGAGGVHWVWDNGWKESNAVRDKDGAPDGFDCIGTQGTAKNIMTVGAIEDIEGGWSSVEDVEVTSFSSFGPTDDGRIKPDIVTNGSSLFSPYYREDDDYASLSGTSMAAPAATGSMVLLQQLHDKLFGAYMRSSMLKGVIAQTADEAGNPGPDYKYGWGLLNTKRAADLLVKSKSKRATLLESSISNEEPLLIMDLYMDDDSAARVTMCWIDPAGGAVPVELDPTNLNLVNDLDLRIERITDGTLFSPFILDPSNPDSPATTGDNFRDNIEQIFFNGTSGYYRLTVSSKGAIVDSVQQFSLIMEGLYPVEVANETNSLTDINGAFTVTTASVVPENRSFSWQIVPNNSVNPQVVFEAFDIDAGEMVMLYDGTSSSDPLLAQFSGVMPSFDTTIVATSGAIYVAYSSLPGSSSGGFRAEYCTTVPAAIDAIDGEAFPCIGEEFIYSVPLLSGARLKWDYDGTLTDTTILSENMIRSEITAESFNLQITPFNSCGSSSPTILQIQPVSSPPVAVESIAGPISPCSDVESLYSVETDNQTSYRWILPEGWESSANESSIGITTQLADSAIIEVVPFNSCGNADTTSLVIFPVAKPVEPLIRSDVGNPCQFSTLGLYVEEEEGVSYRWITDDKLMILGEDTLSTVEVSVFDVSREEIALEISNRCGTTTTSRQLTFNPAPELPILERVNSDFEGFEELVITNPGSYDLVNWYLNDSLIRTSTLDNLVIYANGQYSVEVVNSIGCRRSITSNQQQLVESEDFNLRLETYSEGRVKIINEESEEAWFRIFDLNGYQIASGAAVPGETELNISRSGIFLISLQMEDRITTKKVSLF